MTNKLIILTILIVVVGIGCYSYFISGGEKGVQEEATKDFKSLVLEHALQNNIVPIEGFDAFILMDVFPGLVAADFDGVKSMEGHYEIRSGDLKHVRDTEDPVTSAEQTLSEEGFDSLFLNVSNRLDISASAENVPSVLEEINIAPGEVEFPKEDPVKVPVPIDPVPVEPVACTADAKQCSDGSFVGRVAPSCEFAACPIPVVVEPKPVESGEIMCSKQAKGTACMDVYAPVCGLVEVMCITSPCPPVEETFSNGCSACAQGNVTSYTEGACGYDS